MPSEIRIPFESLEKILEAIYDGDPRVFEAYSAYESDIRIFPTRQSLEKYISDELGSMSKFKRVYCFLHYPGSEDGLVQKRRLKLDPKRCDGARYRYAMGGWGLIQFQLDLTDKENIGCYFAANSEKRANNWSSTYPELGAPSLWNWAVVEKNVRRLIRVLRKNAKRPPDRKAS